MPIQIAFKIGSNTDGAITFTFIIIENFVSQMFNKVFSCQSLQHSLPIFSHHQVINNITQHHLVREYHVTCFSD